MSLPLQLFDSYQKKLITLTPDSTVQADTIKIYTCGPTVYGYQHIGNMRAVWLGDTIVNLAKLQGYKTEWVLNITDVGHLVGDVDTGEDKMEKTAKALNQTVESIVNHYANDYFKQCQALNFSLSKNMEERQPDVNDSVVNPLATDYIEEQMILALEMLLEKRAYTLADGIYFDWEANQDLVLPFQVQQGDSNFTGREIKNTTKNPQDFALWKFVAEDSLQKWKFYDYPKAINVLAQCRFQEQVEGRIMHKWGCPGWHSECVAMIVSILGRKSIKKRGKFSFFDLADKTIIDIHTGGEDHIDIHHKNEILQSEALGFHLSKYWVHNKFVLVDAKKMSKSLGNIYLVTGNPEETGLESLESKGFDPLSYRLMLMEHHYNSQIDFTWDKLTQSQTRLHNLRKECAKLQAFTKLYPNNVIKGWELASNSTELEWLEILAQDLNLPKFLEVYSQLVGSIVNLINSDQVIFDQDIALLKKFDREFLKLNLLPVIPKELWSIAENRLQAKLDQDYTTGDVLRLELSSKGYQVDDYKWGYGLWQKNNEHQRL
jgi:cysteinyl-tRNA synthetase